MIMRSLGRATFHLAVLLAASLMLISLAVAGCATNRKPDVTVATTSTTVLAAVTELTNGVTQMVQAGMIPQATGRRIADHVQIVHDKAADLTSALKAYHAATTPLDQQSKGAIVQTLLAQLSGPIAAILGVSVPDGTVQRLNALVGRVLAVVAAVQQEVARGLGGPPVFELEPVYDSCDVR